MLVTKLILEQGWQSSLGSLIVSPHKDDLDKFYKCQKSYLYFWKPMEFKKLFGDDVFESFQAGKIE